jgi:DNA polymerase IV
MLHTERVIIHIDMDAFFASVEHRDHPEYKGKPLISGVRANRSVVSTACYEARKYGVRSAMPMIQALRLCPQAIVVPPRHQYYAEISHQLFEIFERFTPEIEGLSLDEAFLDVTHSQSLFGTGEVIAQKIRSAIEKELRLTASAGIAPNKFIAKVASEQNKPNGQTLVTRENIHPFLDKLPISALWGLGKKSTELLNRHGITRVSQFRTTPKDILKSILHYDPTPLLALAQGIDERPIQTHRERKSYGSEETFEKDQGSKSYLETILLQHASIVSRHLMHAKVRAHSLSVKVRWPDFSTHTKQMTFSYARNDTLSIFEECCKLLQALNPNYEPLRLIGISAKPKEEAAEQLELWKPENVEKQEVIDRLQEQIQSRFGSSSLTRASLLKFTNRAHYDKILDPGEKNHV